jgi:hypothetical protein
MSNSLLGDVVAKKLEQYVQDYVTVLQAISDDQLWSTTGNLPNSVGTLARHLTGNLNHYFGTAILHSGYVRVREQEFSERSMTRAQVIAELQAASKIAVEALHQVDEAALAQPYTSPEGNAYESLALYIVHMAMHFAMHYGQADYSQHVLKQAAQ